MERQIITVDIAPGNSQVERLGSSQGDIGRPLGVYIIQNGVALDCSAYSAELYILKPDGKFYTTQATVDATATNLIKWDTAEQETPVAGACAAQIRITAGDDDIGTARFVEFVEASPCDMGAASKSEVALLTEYVHQARESATSAGRDATTASDAASSASGSASTATTAANTATQAATAATTAADRAEAVEKSIPADYTQLSDDVTGLKSAIDYTRSETLRIDEKGKTWLKGEFIVGSLNNSGEITNNARRIVTKDITYYDRDIQIGIATGYQVLYAVYPDGESPSLTIKAADFSISKNTKFRISVMAIPTEPTNADMDAFIDAITVNSKIYSLISECNTGIEENAEAIEAFKNRETDISSDIEYTAGHFIQTNGQIGDLSVYSISDLIELKDVETIEIYANGGTASIVSILSEWDSTGTTFIKNLYTCTGDVYETITHKADHHEYLKICYLNYRDIPVVKIIEPSNEELIDSINILKDKTINLFADISMFDDIAVCGDSYTAGSIFSGSTLIGDNAKTRWGTVLGRITGADVTTYASGGADTRTWQSRSDCLPKLLTDSPHELYVLCLGINDRTLVAKGTASDMNHAGTEADPFPNTFYGNYASIITQIKAHAPNAKILISKVFIVTYQAGGYYDWSEEAIEDIASKFSIPYIETADADFFSSEWFDENMAGGHPIAATYAGIAKAMAYLISKSIQENTSYYADYYPN